jgi:very-short-patch-repair endonuclease
VCSHDISDVTKGSAADAPRENKLRFWPILDRPHPDSPGEQRLSEALATDALLAELFRFNQVVETAWQRRYIVDLLNAKDRLIVEVDGYHCHRGQRAFNADRLRDFHLITSGYLVIRIPHDEVMHDVRAALEKIRSLVRFRRQGKINREAM